jgi:hypothetical protein
MFFVFFVLLLAACNSLHEQRMNSSLDKFRASESTNIDHAKCKAEGGTVKGVGMLGTPSCVIPYSDANKTCSDSKECQGACTTEPTKSGTTVTGKCSVDSASIFGCYSVISNGKAEAGLCVD